MGKKVYVINGKQLTGKDAFIEMINDNTERTVYNISTVDEIREFTQSITKTKEKNDNIRTFMMKMKALLNEHFDYSYNFVDNFIKNNMNDNDIVFIHAREAHELDMFKEEFGAKLILVLRGDTREFSHEADNTVFDVDYDYVINNNYGLEELEFQAIEFIKDVINCES